MKKSILLFVLLPLIGFSQSIQIDNDATLLTPEQLIVEQLVESGSCSEVQFISSQVYQPTNPNQRSAGHFINTNPDFPFEEGIILSSGFVKSAEVVNGENGYASDSTNGLGDSDLQYLNPTGSIFDTTILEFKIKTARSHISFNYIFASEEYEGGNGYACTFADTFAFIISGPGIDNVNTYQLSASDPGSVTNIDLGGKDIALIPGTNIPVSVTNVFEYFDGTTCTGGVSGSYEEYYTSNWESNFNGAISYNGMTVPLTAEADVIPGEWYTIKLKIGDAIDSILDSAVFLETGSLDLTDNLQLPEDMIVANDNPVCGDEIQLGVELTENTGYQWYFNDTPIEGATSNTYTAQSIEAGGLGDGNYMLEADFGGGCLAMDSIQLEFVDPPAPPDNIPDFLLCDPNGDGVESFDLSSYDYILATSENVTVSYFLSEEDANDNVNAITGPYTNTDLQETIYARLENYTGCYTVTSFNIGVSQINAQEVSSGGCAIEPGSSEMEINLTQFDPDLSGGADDTTVTYYTNQADADAGENAIGNTYTGPSTTLYARVENSIGCYDTAPLNLTIHPMPQAMPVDEILVCNEGNSTGIYDLNPVIEQAAGDQENLSVSIFQSLEDAMNTENALELTDVSLTAPRTLYIRVENEFGCADYGTVDLKIHNCPPVIPNTFTPNDDGVNDEFTIHRLKTIYEDYHLRIYNRWGNLVYEGGPDDPFWDGTVDGVLTNDPSGTVYFYVLELNDGENKPVKGTIFVKP